MLAFVEVKARRTQDRVPESVSPKLRKRLERAASQRVSRRRGLQQHPWRFDIVMLAPGRLPRHVGDARRGSEFVHFLAVAAVEDWRRA